MEESLVKPIRLLLVDDHEIVRVGLKAGFQRSRTIEVVGEAATAAEAVAECTRLKPDLVLLDVRLPDGSGIDVCREIRTTCPETRVLFLTSYSDASAMLSTVLAGAHGFLLKHVNGDALTKAIETVAQGQSILDPALTEPLLEQIRAVAAGPDEHANEQLSPQERKVLALVAEGKTNKEIATSLELSDRTVKNYLSNAFEKLHVTRRSQAAVVYARLFPPR